MKTSSPMLYRRHEIRSRNHQGTWRAQAVRGRRMVGPILDGSTEAAAVDAVRAYLDREAEIERASRGDDGYPLTVAVEAAFAQIKPTDKQWAMLKAHVAAPEQSLTATELAQAAHYSSYETANSQYGGLGRALAEELDWMPQIRASDGQPIWTYALATDGIRSENGEWRWRLRPQVAEAMRLFLDDK